MQVLYCYDTYTGFGSFFNLDTLGCLVHLGTDIFSSFVSLKLDSSNFYLWTLLSKAVGDCLHWNTDGGGSFFCFSIWKGYSGQHISRFLESILHFLLIAHP
jgi:hypothetical protein